MPNWRMSVFGHRHFSLFFRPLIEVTANGFKYKGRDYAWEAIQRVEVRDSPLLLYFWFPAAPRATITLVDGKRIRLNGRALEKQGLKPSVGFYSAKSDAFNELIRIFRSHAA